MSKSEPFIDVSVRVSDGSFESRLSIPVASTKDQRSGLLEMWVGMLANACKISLPSEVDKGSTDER